VFPEAIDSRPDESTRGPVTQPVAQPGPQSDESTLDEEPAQPDAHSHDKATPPKEPSRFDRLSSFLAGRGFHWDDSTSIFVGPDGSFVHKSEGIFPWELVSSVGVNPLWLATSSLSDREGIELPAEIWNAARREDAVLLSPEGNGYREEPFSRLRADVDARKLDLYPAVFRIKLPDEVDESTTTTAFRSTSERPRPTGVGEPGGANGSSG
jgi:hypothetical protein